MGYNKENYARIRQEFQGKNLRAKEAAEARCAELHKNNPELEKIDKLLSATGMNILCEAAKGSEGLDKRIERLKLENQELLAAREAYLASIGYPADYTSVKYDCTTCSDTGFTGTKMCECMRRELIAAGYESAGLSKLIKTQSFDTFSLDYYKDTPGAAQNMGNVVELCKNYANNFDSSKGECLLLAGKAGLGKTHLSTAIAKVIIERGFDVVYETAQNILADFEYERFTRTYSDTSAPRTDKYFECDLLIIDDLGTEVANQFTVACLYNIINTRLNAGKAMLINTNLSQKEITDRYGERINSRLFGEFMGLRFAGKDIRLKKAKQ